MAQHSDKIDAASLPEFFRERIREAVGRQNLKIPECVEFYLVNLLQECVTTGRVYGEASPGFKEEPLAFLLCRALQAEEIERIQLLKRLGDFSLYISGFFPASFNRQLVDTSYYIQMGESAYGNLSTLVNRRAAAAEIFGELAERFAAYVDILNEVSEKSQIERNSDLLRLYETWLKTGSERARQLLSDKGILPLGVSTKVIQ